MKKILISMLLFGVLLSGCNNEQNSQGGTNSGEVEPEKPKKIELTPLEKEISKLEDFQMTDKVYDNKDLELYNKIQGYLYTATRGNDSLEIIELIAPENIKGNELSGYSYRFEGYIATPCIYQLDTKGWGKWYPANLGETNSAYYMRAPKEYICRSDEEFSNIFGEVELYDDCKFTESTREKVYQLKK